ncbi:hypothetical protein KEM55_004695 [Ascosphaera atra]|nr:hypothetical protein KEM55_004695 [Ascosphaera atra]
MATVIVGGGIIGLSIAYHLSLEKRDGNLPRDIHVIDASPELFASASGYAAGFLARDWFEPALAPLGELSFDLHRQYADENNGQDKWKYATSIALSLGLGAEEPASGGDGDGHDWIRQGSSRGNVAAGSARVDAGVPMPGWITQQKGRKLEVIGNDGSCAQVDPLLLCKWLLARCKEQGVQIHHPARATRLMKDESSNIVKSVRFENSSTAETSEIPCSNLVFAAGAWTPIAFDSLLKSSTTVPIEAVPGYSLVVKSPRHTNTHEDTRYGKTCHSLFTSHPREAGFSPELFSRLGAEIYIAGLNPYDIPLPSLPTESRKAIKSAQIEQVRRAAVMLMGRAKEEGVVGDYMENIDDLEVQREALCFRPVTDHGLPIVARLQQEDLGCDARFTGGVFLASGHGPWGISLSLGTGKVMAELIQGKKTSADISGLAFPGSD